MPGPPPKDPELRARTNKPPSAARLSHRGRTIDLDSPPELPERPDGPWMPAAVRVWDEAWASPMATEYLPADVPGLELLCDLVHRYHALDVDPGTVAERDRHSLRKSYAAEIEKHRRGFGLSPVDRWRLHWTIDHGDGKRHGRARPAAPQPPTHDPDVDPRALLRAVE